MTGVRICETVTASTLAELRRRRDQVDRADMVELRLDGVEDVDVAGALQGRRKPVIVTCRPRWEGGRFEGGEEKRLALLADAVRLGAEYVDVEHRAKWQVLPRRDGTDLILSFHDWQGVPADLPDRVRQMRQAGADVVKVAVTARRLGDCLTLGAACQGAGRLAAIAMGSPGQITRTCPWLFGSCWTYAGEAAPGQVSTAVLIDRYRVRQGSRSTALYGVVGRPLVHSASPAIHNAAFAEARIDATYVPLEGESAADIEALASAFGLRGLSVTAPFKEDVFAQATSADQRTERLGAANTLRRTEEGWDARNFDVDGFLDPLDRGGHQLAGERVVVLGAGGAARAVVLALLERQARVGVAARRRGAAERLAGRFGSEIETWPPQPGWHMLVNATPVGMWPAPETSPLPADALKGPVVYDLVYNPLETTLMREARAGGADVIGGLEMLIGQACRQFEWWTGQTAPRESMWRAAHTFVTREVRESHEADHV